MGYPGAARCRQSQLLSTVQRIVASSRRRVRASARGRKDCWRMTEQRARYGWQSGFSEFQATDPGEIRGHLEAFVRDASAEQLRAWSDAIPPLQHEVGEVLLRDQLADKYSAILEYELPLEFRRPDVVLL